MSLLLSTGAFASSLSGAAPGMVLMKPTSIAHSGTSATLGANGQVTFSAVTSLSLNGCFTADFDNYVVSIRHVANTGNQRLHIRLRASGSDASGTDYTWQALTASSTSVTAARSTSQTEFRLGQSSVTHRSGSSIFMYGPFLAQPTAARNVDVSGTLDAYIMDAANTHSLSTSYDGFTMLPEGVSEFTGALAVYGIRS